MTRRKPKEQRRRPGEVRDAIVTVLRNRPNGATVGSISEGVEALVGRVPASSIRSYLQLNTPGLFARMDRAQYTLAELGLPKASRAISGPAQSVEIGGAVLFREDCLDWMAKQAPNSISAVVTDPPYGLLEYSDREQDKLRSGKGGVWRIPPSFDGSRRSPLPRFTVLKPGDLDALEGFFFDWASRLRPVLVPGANVLVACNPLLSHLVAMALSRAGLERRGEIVRLVMTMRGGDRPKDAHLEFSEVSVMPRSMWEPWLVFRKPLDGRVQDNLRKWGTGGFRRISETRPFGDVIESAPTRTAERKLAPHPSLKPQAFMRQIVRAVLPLGEGVILDPFAGAGSTLAAANAIGYRSIGIERDQKYFEIARLGIHALSKLHVDLS